MHTHKGKLLTPKGIKATRDMALITTLSKAVGYQLAYEQAIRE